jgi:16S rRNA (adenine(1408)-N(1))-methyltransferase
MTLDLGTGDGRLPYTRAREAPDRLFVGVDADAAGLRVFSRRALRAGLPNVAYVRAALEALPRELAGTADGITVLLPWGSLLAAVARPNVEALGRIRGLCRPGAALTVVVAVDPVRDRAEAARLGLAGLGEALVNGALVAGYASAGFVVDTVRPLSLAELARWPSTWARRLAHGRPRPVQHIEARAVGGQTPGNSGRESHVDSAPASSRPTMSP